MFFPRKKKRLIRIALLVFTLVALTPFCFSHVYFALFRKYKDSTHIFHTYMQICSFSLKGDDHEKIRNKLGEPNRAFFTVEEKTTFYSVRINSFDELQISEREYEKMSDLREVYDSCIGISRKEKLEKIRNFVNLNPSYSYKESFQYWDPQAIPKEIPANYDCPLGFSVEFDTAGKCYTIGDLD